MNEVKETLKDLEYKNWSFEICEKEPIPLLKIEATHNGNAAPVVPDSYKKWYLHKGISFQELVQLIFLAVSTIEKHILSYQFLYKKISIFSPHEHTDKYIKIENRILDPKKSKVITCLDDIIKIVGEIEYSDWEFCVFEEGIVPILQIRFKEIDTITGMVEYQYSRKWAFTYHEMGETQVIQTCYLAVSTAVRHESRERFLYKKKWIANPHRSIKLILEEKNN